MFTMLDFCHKYNLSNDNSILELHDSDRVFTTINGTKIAEYEATLYF